MKKNEYIAPENMKKKKFTCVSIRNEPNDIHANDHLAVGVCSFCFGVFSAILIVVLIKILTR